MGTVKNTCPSESYTMISNDKMYGPVYTQVEGTAYQNDRAPDVTNGDGNAYFHVFW